MSDDLARVMAVSAVLCDMDGTLVDSAEAITSAWDSFARRYGLDSALVSGLLPGRTARDIIATAMGNRPIDLTAELERLRQDQLRSEPAVRAILGAARLLRSLSSGQWALVTAATTDVARHRMTQAGLPLPDVIVSGDDVTAGKPDPQGFTLAARRLGVDPRECLVLEDSLPGVQAARAAGARVVGIGETSGAALAIPDLRRTYIEATATGDGMRINVRPRTERTGPIRT